MTDNQLERLKDLAPELEGIVGLIEGDAASMTETLLNVHNKLKDLVERVRAKRDLALYHVNQFRDMRNEVTTCAADIERVLDAVGSQTQLPTSEPN